MLLGGAAGQRVEPVSVVARAVVQRPLLHALSHAVGQLAAQRLAVVDGVYQRHVRLAGQVLKHLLSVEHLLAVVPLYPLLGKLNLHCFPAGGLKHTLYSEV